MNENPKVLSLTLNVTFIIMGLIASLVILVWSPTDSAKDINPFLLAEWSVLDTRGWLAMTVLAVVIILGSLFAAIAYQNGPPAVIAVFDYSYLVFSALWGLLIFSETPDGLTVFGMFLIVGSGLLALRER